MSHRGWSILRGLLLFSGISLVGYIGYRYTMATAPDHGTVYGKIFPLSALLAGFAILLAVEPGAMRGIDGTRGKVLRAGLTLLGGVWMATGVMCVQSLASGMLAAPFSGTLDMLHMVSDHIVLPIGLAIVAWTPASAHRRTVAADAAGETRAVLRS